MPLPPLIEIVPLDKPVQAQVTVPGSKSITNRALILAALAERRTVLEGALWSEDTQVMVECLQKLGFAITVAPDPLEACNRMITVQGRGGQVLLGGTDQQPLQLFVGNAGTAARFLAAFVCLGQGVYRLFGAPRMHERPQAELFAALRQLGYDLKSERGDDKLPVTIIGGGPLSGGSARLEPRTGRPADARARSCAVSLEHSSQFASALLLCAKAGRWDVELPGQNSEDSPYVAMTSKLIAAFPERGGTFRIEPDASSGSYFWAAAHLAPVEEHLDYAAEFGVAVPTTYLPNVSVANWPSSGWQIDQEFPGVLLLSGLPRWLGSAEEEKKLAQTGAPAEEALRAGREMLPHHVISRQRDLGDSIMMLIVMAPYSLAPMRFTDLGRLRLQECERVAALRTELTRCGAKVIEKGDSLTVYPSPLHGAAIETYNDHRIAMCFAILGLKTRGMRIKNPSCVKKTFPSFFLKLAAPPPHGLGAAILDGHTGRRLRDDELFAE